VLALTPQLRRLAALLTVSDGAPVSADRIAEYLADGPVDGSAVRTAVSRLRKVLGDRVQTAEAGYRLVLAPDELDGSRFIALCDRARTAGPVERCALLTEGLALWRGPALEEFADESWATVTATQFDELRAIGVEDLGEVLIETGRPGEAVVLLEAHAADQPYRERPVALLMRALAATGRVTEALRWFQRFRTTLREEIGIEPTSALRELESELLRGVDDGRETPAVSRRLPTGTVTFMFTDIEGSTEQWQRDEAAMAAALAAHDRTIRSVVDAHDGVVFKHTGDGICAVFTSAPAAVQAAVEMQRELSLRVRIGLHTGEAELRDADYFGPTMNRTARVMDAGHGGQVLVSASTAALTPDQEFLDLGVHRLKGLSAPERILQVGTGAFPPLRVASQRAGNLPVELTSFIGRSGELSKLTDELAEHRLVTLIGVGGTGKTRLAIEAAHAMAPLYPDGCWIVELAPVTLEDSVPVAFAAGLGVVSVAEGGDVVGDLVRRLRHKRLLLVVDNCEHLLAASADVVEQLVSSCPTLTVLVTSREPLMISGEHLVPVPSLAASDAERLFVERARAEAPSLQLDDQQRAAIVELCRRLDGLPLAIELAASRVRAFSPVELATQLDERFRLLVGGRRSRMERHQTMRGTLDWSYDLCTETEQAVFDRLAVFPAAFDLAGARAVGAAEGVSELDVVDTVPHLVDRSLLQRSTAADGTTRYRMLETMRAYGREHLQHAATSDATRERHARYTADTLCALSLRLFGPDEYWVRQRFEEHYPDASVALDWFVEHGDWEQCLRFVPGSRVVTEPESLDLAERLSAACRSFGADPGLIDEVDELRENAYETSDDWDRRNLRRLHRPDRFPEDRFFWPPTLEDTSPGGLEASIACLDRVASSHAIVRFVALTNVAEALIEAGDYARAGGYLDELDQLAETLSSERARVMVASIRGIAAARQGDYALANRIFDDAATRGLMPRRNRTDIRFAWNRLRFRVLGGMPITGAELRSAWDSMREESALMMQWRAAISAAIVVDRQGDHDLAMRLGRWVRRTYPGDGESTYRAEFAALGLDPDQTTEADHPRDDLHAMMAEVLAITDKM
jgi:predicted ATPase/class 3 adenylate cyclase